MAAVNTGVDLLANVDTIILDIPANFDATLNIRLVNRNNNTPIKVRIAIVDDVAANALTSLGNQHYIEYDTIIRENGVLESSGVVVPSGYTVVVRSDANNTTGIAFGYMEQLT